MPRVPDAELLEEIGLTLYERKALMTLSIFALADAATICREGDIPSSKIYLAMEKLTQLGLIQTQPTRPKLFAALPPGAVADRLVELVHERAERFASRVEDLRALLMSLPGRARGKQASVDLAMGAESYVRRHVVHLSTARERIVSYMERGDLDAIDNAEDGGFPVLRRIARNAAARKVRHTVVFGFSYQTAPRLVEFLRKHKVDLRHVTGVRYSGELGHPFHVVDDELVVLPLDHPFVPDGRFASLMIRDRELAQNLAGGFEKLWIKAMRNLQEINFDPRGGRARPG